MAAPIHPRFRNTDATTALAEEAAMWDRAKTCTSEAAIDATSVMPRLKPLLLTNLSYRDAIHQLRATGCAIARQQWCAPIVAIRNRREMLDNDGELSPWHPTPEDRKATDWYMIADPDGRAELRAMMAIADDEA